MRTPRCVFAKPVGVSKDPHTLTSTTQPESGVTAYEYFDNGILKEKPTSCQEPTSCQA